MSKRRYDDEDMATKMLPIIEALNSCDWPKVCIIAACSEDDPFHVHYQVLKASISYRRGQMTLDAALAAIRKSLDSPPDVPELLAAVLCASIGILADAGNLKEAQRIAGLLSELRPSIRSRELKARMLMSLSNFAYAEGRHEETLALLEEALKLGITRGGPMWSQVKALHAHKATNIGEYGSAQQDLDELESVPGIENYLSAPVSYLRACLCYQMGRHQQGLAWLESLAASGMDMNTSWSRHVKCQLLLKAGKLRQADELIESLEREGQFPKPVTEELRAAQSLARRDLDGARYHAKLTLAGAATAHPSVTGWATNALIEAELADGRAKAARRVLCQVDPDENHANRSLQWARLYMLEGDDIRAASHFRKLIQDCDLEVIEDRLRWAWELSPSQFARLLRLSQKQADGPDKNALKVEPSPVVRECDIEGEEFVGVSQAAMEIRRHISQFAPLDAPVLITGETGTGKEVVANLLHKNGPNFSEPFLAINCGAMSDTLVESELFGHIKGAFTGAMRDNEGLFIAAGRGTLFLDEIHAMSPRLQASLMRVLESQEVRPVGSAAVRKVHARVIAATNESLNELVERKAFRMDLYFRLARLHIDIRPLRQRVEDIPVLARHFLRLACGETGVALGEDLLEALKRYDWPGNVRELKHEIERNVLLSGDSHILGASLFETGPRLRGSSGSPISSPSPAPARATPGGSPAEHEPAAPLRQSHRRRQRVKELFDRHDRLTRAEVIQFLQCSPNTATGDLKALEQEGCIRRVNTSGNLRTSYFVRVGRQ